MSLQQSNPGLAAVEVFIKDELFKGLPGGFDENTDLITAGVIDSLSLLRLVTFVEDNCQVRVLDEEMVPENFRSLAAIQSFVANHALAHESQTD